MFSGLNFWVTIDVTKVKIEVKFKDKGGKFVLLPSRLQVFKIYLAIVELENHQIPDAGQLREQYFSKFLYRGPEL